MLKQELKKVNAEAAKVRDLPANERAEFGRKINAKKQVLLAQIAEVEQALLQLSVVHIWAHFQAQVPETLQQQVCSLSLQ